MSDVVVLGQIDTRPFKWDCVANGHVYVGTDPCAHCGNPYPDDPATGCSLTPAQKEATMTHPKRR